MNAMLERLSTPRWVLYCSIAYFMGQATMMLSVGEVMSDLLRLQLAFTPETYHAITEQWNPNQWIQYQRHFLPDFFFPWLYAIFLFSWLARHLLLADKKGVWNALLLLPWMTAIADCLENLLHLWMIQSPELISSLITGCSLISLFKWLVALGLVLILSALELVRLRSR